MVGMKRSLCSSIFSSPVSAARQVRCKPTGRGPLGAALMMFVCLSLLLGSQSIASARQANDGREDRVKALMVQLHAPEVRTRRFAVRALGEMGPVAKSAVPMLAASVHRGGTSGEPDGELRSTAAWALGRIGAAAKETVPDLTAALDDEVSAVRASAAFALGYIGAEPDKVLPALSRALRDRDHEVRTSAGFALANIGKPAIPVLAAALSAKVSGVRRDAASALGCMSIQPASAVPALVAVLGDSSAEVRDTAVWTLKGIGSPAVPALITALHDKRSVVRGAVAVALGYIGVEARSAVPALRVARKDPVAAVRRKADTALMLTGTPAPSQEQEQAVQDAVFKYLFAYFNMRGSIKLAWVSFEVGKVSQAQLQRLRQAGIPARLESDETQAEYKALPPEAGVLSMKIASLRWMNGGYVLARVEAFTGERGNEGISVEHYAMLRVRRRNGKWKVLGTLGEWTIGDA